jgi:hypothetical protein
VSGGFLFFHFFFCAEGRLLKRDLRIWFVGQKKEFRTRAFCVMFKRLSVGRGMVDGRCDTDMQLTG